MMIIVTIIHVVMCLILIAIVLLQTGKGASMGAAFGGASNTLFGGAGPANFLNKITTIAAVLFMFTSFTLAILSGRQATSSKVLDAPQSQQEQPVGVTVTPAAQTERDNPGTTTSTTEDTASNPSTGSEQPITSSTPGE